MAVGAAKLKAKGYEPRSSKDDEINHEEVYLAQRVQTNQVEQVSPFLVGSYSCALLVDGKVAKLKAKGYEPRSSKDDEINHEEVYLAQRVQTNQVEQVSPF